MERKRNLWLDLFKLVLCWMVICIHFLGDTYAYYPVYRLAVPMFFAISGYFQFRPEAQLSCAVGFVKRSLRYLLLGFSFYILFDFVMCYVDGRGVGYYFTTLFYENIWFEFVFLNRPVTYSGAQLWFLIALLMISLVHYGLVRFRRLHWYRWIVPACLLIQLFFGGYMRLLQYTDMPIRYTRNAWFMGLPFFGLGWLLARPELHKKSWYTWLYLVLGLGFAGLQIVESRWVQTEVYAATIPATAFLLLFFMGLPVPDAAGWYRVFGKNMSFWVYVLHMAVGIVLGRLWDFSTPMMKSLAILAISMLLYTVGYWLLRLLRRLNP